MEELDLTIRILVVDDSATMRRIISQALKDIGFTNIVTAEDGDDAWEIVQGGRVNLVISDHKMPRMTGIELLQKVRDSEEYGDLPFVMVTAEGYRENVMEAVKLKVDGYVVKPFSAKQLLERILRVIGAKAGKKVSQGMAGI